MNKRLFIYTGLLLIVLIMMFFLTKRSKQHETASTAYPVRDLPEIKASGFMRLLATYTPSEYTISKDRINGKAFDIARLLEEKTNISTQVLLENRWEIGSRMLLNGEVDIILFPVFQTSEIDTTLFSIVDRTDEEQLYLVQRKNDSLYHIKEQIELGGDTVVLPKNRALKLFIEHLSSEIGENIHIKTDELYQTEQLAIMVSKGLINYTVCTQKQQELFKTAFPDLDCSLPISYNLIQGWITRKSSPILTDSINRWFQKNK